MTLTWLTPAEASAHTGLSVKTLSRAVDRGEIGKYLVQRRHCYRKDELDAWTAPRLLKASVTPDAPTCPHCGQPLPLETAS